MPRRGRPRHPSLLTPGEQRVLEELRKGGTNAEIAVRLGLSPETVKTHIASMLSKLNLRDRRDLAALRPQEESGHRHILGVIGLPSGLSLSMRPLVWAGAGLAGVAGMAAATLFIAAMMADGDQTPTVSLVSTPAAETTPSPPAQQADPLSIVTPEAPSSPAPLDLIVVSDGSSDSLLLEWTGGPAATIWQYRKRAWRSGFPLGWGAWTDVPNSTGSTRRHVVTDLPAQQGYEFQVRALIGAMEGPASQPAKGATQFSDGQAPMVVTGLVVEGDGRTLWRFGYLNWKFVIPDGMRLQGGRSFFSGHASLDPEVPPVNVVAVIIDHESGSSLVFGDGYEIDREVVPSGLQSTTGRDVGALFDQIVASVVHPP